MLKPYRIFLQIDILHTGGIRRASEFIHRRILGAFQDVIGHAGGLGYEDPHSDSPGIVYIFDSGAQELRRAESRIPVPDQKPRKASALEETLRQVARTHGLD